MSAPEILVILLNFRTPEMTLRAAETALRELEDLPGELLVIDNGSGDDSFDVIDSAARARGWYGSGKFRLIASQHNGGFGAGMNIGFRTGLSDGRKPGFYYLLNSDAFPEPGAVRVLRDFLTKHPRAGMAGSFLRGPDGEPHRTAFRFPSVAGEFEGAVRTGIVSRLFSKSIVAMEIPKQETRVDWTAGASLMIRRELIDEIGGFDETFFLYFEETDLCHRATNAGWTTHYLPQSEVVHIGSASTGMKTWARTPPYWFDSRLHYFVKTHGRAYAVAATLARIGGVLLWRLRCLIQTKPQADPPGFATDLLRHSLRAALGRHTPMSHPPSLSSNVTEDVK
jgi:hypothetical protein